MGEKYQSNVISEIIETERSYLLQLEKLQNYFSKPILERGILPSHAHSAIFSQLLAIYQMNSKLLEEILDGKENIGSAFLKLGPFLKVYSSYANNFQRALIVLQEWESKNEEFKSFVACTETRPEVQTKLTSLLITPIQRIPRYRLLLQDLLKHSDTSYHNYSDIEGALRQVTAVAEHINQSVDDSQALNYLLLLQKALKNGQPSIIAPGRRLIKEGLLNKVSRKGNGSQARIFFLFSDMLMYTKVPTQNLASSLKASVAGTLDLKPSSLECCCVLPLRYCKVTTLFGSGDQGITFRLQCADEDLLLYSSCSSEGEGWVRAIGEAAREALEKRRTLRKASSRRKAVRRMPLRRFTFSEDEEQDAPLPVIEEQQQQQQPKTSSKFLTKTESLKGHLRSVRECLTPPKTFLTPKQRQSSKPSRGSQTPLAVRNQLSPTNNNNNNNNDNKLRVTRTLSPGSCSRLSPGSSPGSSSSLTHTPKLNRFQGERQSHRTPPPISPLATCSWDRGSTPRNSSTSFVFRSGVRGREGSQLTPSPSASKGKKRPLSDILTPPWGKAFKKD